MPELGDCRWAGENTKVVTVLHSSFYQEMESISSPCLSGLVFGGIECRGCKFMEGLGLDLRRPYSVYSFTLKTVLPLYEQGQAAVSAFCLLQSLPAALDSSLQCFID